MSPFLRHITGEMSSGGGRPGGQLPQSLPTVIPCPISFYAGHSGDRIALRLGPQTRTYLDLDSRIQIATATMSRTGVSRGDIVAMTAYSGEDTIVWLWASLRVGARVLMLSDRLPEASLRERLLQCGARWTVGSEYGSDPGSVDSGGVKILPRIPPPDGDADGLGEPELRTEPEPELCLDEPATLLYTSGSTGAPTVAVHTLANHIVSALGVASRVPLDGDTAWLLSLPVYHVGGLAILFRAFLAGASVTVSGDWLKDSQVYATHLSLVNTQLDRLLESRPSWLRSVREVIVGGGPVTPASLQWAVEADIPIRTTYGSTEMSSQVTLSDVISDGSAALHSGSLLPYRELRISDSGEIHVRGEVLFAGYLVDGQVRDPARADGWYHTGDLGHFSGGNLIVTGRLDNQFVSGGENIQPEEIEDCLRRVPGIADAVVVPIPSREYGRRPVAFLKFVSRPDVGARIPTSEEVERELRRHLPGFKIPDAFLDWPEIAEVGLKVSRSECRSLAEGLYTTQD